MQCIIATANVLHMTNTHNTPTNNLIADTFTVINDQVFCSLIEVGVDPGTAYQVAFVDVPTETDYIRPEFAVDVNTLMDHDDVVLALQ